MRYLKENNFEVEYVFKKLINWKEYNYLLSKLTECEDDGYLISLTICICENSNNIKQGDLIGVFYYNTNRKNGFFTLNSSSLTYVYDKNKKFYYKIYLKDPDNGFSNSFPSEFYDKIKDKFRRMEYNINSDLILTSIR